MNKLSLLFAAISSTALALPPVHPVLPPVEYIDTETTTNVPFMAWQEHVGKFKLSLTCCTTATNNVQFAFGRDADNDGILSLEESDLVDAGMFYRKNWNMFRLTGRGLADSAESSVVQILPDSLTILMR